MPDGSQNSSADAYSPAEIARRVKDVGVVKAKLSTFNTLALAILAGAFIALGGAFATVATTGSELGFGPTRVLGGVVFSLGLILVVVAGAELFTGNNLVAMAWASRAITTRQLIRNWLLAYVGNFLGAVGTAVFVYWSGTWMAGGTAVGLNAVQIAASKCELGFGDAFVRGVLCNALVCLAVWLCQSCRSTTDKILAIIWPIAGFVALGFEHSVANMYFIPLGMLLENDPGFLTAAPVESLNTASLSAHGFLSNLISVTLGNIVGGTLLVAGVYWSVYLRNPNVSESK
ncbi:MAG TPA: formate/nitrite transporter family protein [Planctomycetaceae bacterium]|nr:formate/nitrite transporter family protein [Planctomycetaceae bacterium]